MPKHQKVKVVDLFCGIGGLSHGMKRKGFNIIAGFDIDDSCKYSYESNNDSTFFKEDIKQVKGERVSKLFGKSGVKVLAGCAPCQPFSSYAFKMKEKDKNKYDLLYEFGRLVEEVLPDIVTMENVAQILAFKEKPVLHDFVETLKRNGYHVCVNKVFCPDYGIPQTRTRLVLLASILGPIELIPPTHSKENYVTVFDTIGHLPPIKAGEISSEDMLHRARSLSDINLRRIEATPASGSWKDWSEDLHLECHKKSTGKSFGSVYGRMTWDKPAPTMTTLCTGLGNGRFGHPEQDRAISLREAALFQTFPEDYHFFKPDEEISVTRASRYIGNAVPPRLGEITALSITKHLEKYGKEENEKLKWRFDISTFRLIGRELITDRITALFELLKNSYDANSTRVDIIFENVTYKDNDENLIGSKITIRDNGYGMSFSDIRDKWMVIGTANKRKNPISPDPFNRRCVGEKGIGRFAVDKLGNKVEITTKKNLDNRWLKVEIDWDNYSTPREDNDITLFTDIENQYSYINTGNSTESGTLLEISDIRENWSAGDIKRFRDEANKIVSPYYTSNPPFEIYISAPEFKIFTEKVERKTVDFATIQQEITFNKLKNKQEIIKFNEDSGEFYKETIPIKSFGGISLKLYFFDEFARKKYHNAFSDRIDGIKIYRDGIITTPFAESEYSQDKKRDILGIDKRLWQDMFSRVSTREIIGNLDISKIENPLIIDSTNRQDFLDNTQYRELKDFIIEQLYAFQQYKIFVRSKKKKNINDELKEATQNVDLFTSVVNQVVQSNPELRIELQPLIDQARKTSSTVKKAIKEHKDAEKEFLRKESLYLSIMSLQEYAIQIAHAVRTSLGKVESKAKFFYDYYPDPDEAEYFKLYSKEIYHEMKVLDNVINFMLSYSRSNLSFDNIHISRLVSGLFENYKTTFNSEKITLILDIRDNLQINSNEQFFFDIFQNLISNSIKALKNNTTKLIKCSLYSENNNLIIIFSDNGYGIPFDKREWVFGLYNTTTEDTGGAGVGLFIVKTRIESLNGTIKIIDSEYGNQGVSFKIELPFKK